MDGPRKTLRRIHRLLSVVGATFLFLSCNGLIGPFSNPNDPNSSNYNGGSSGSGGGTSSQTYTVTYNKNGATGGMVPVDSNKYEQGQTVTVLGNTGSLVKTGYNFNGWNTAADGSGSLYTQGQTFPMGIANVTLYALWTALPTYTVTYNGNGNTGGSAPIDTTNYTQGQTVTALGNTGNLVRIGYSFNGWNTTANGSGATYQPGATFAMASGNVTLYAKWTVAYTVTYNGNGNTGGSVPTDSNYYQPGATVTVLGNTGSLVKSGYAFAGWNTASNAGGTSYLAGATFTIGSANVTLYAQWAAAYTVTYNGNGNTGGSVPVDSSSYPQGATVTVLGNTGSLVRTGFVFAGWNTTPDGSGTMYLSGSTFNLGNTNVTLYAAWMNYVYAGNAGAGTISAFSIGSSGGLSSVGTVTFDAGGTGNVQIAASPTGSYLYVTQLANVIWGFFIGPGGVLSSIGAFATPSYSYEIAISPNSKYLYATIFVNNSVSAFSIGADGTLSSIGTYSTGSSPYGIAVNPNGNYLYVANYGGNSITAFTIGSGGTLSSIGTYSTGSSPFGIAISPSGGYLYVANNGNNTVSAFAIGGSGALSSIGSFSAGSGPTSVATAPP